MWEKPLRVTQEIRGNLFVRFATGMKILHYDAASSVRWAHIFTLKVGSLNSAPLLTGWDRGHTLSGLQFL